MIRRRTMTEGEMGETATMAGAVFCRARMNYVSRGGFGESVEPTEVTVYDGRRAALPGWQTCGFELRKHASALDDWSDDVQIERVHYAEISAFARSLTGCDHALVSGHIKRDPEQAAKHPDLGPIEFVHSDFAKSYGQRMRDFYRDGSDEATKALARSSITANAVAEARRIAIVQFWRNIGPAKMDRPIAFCDARTVKAAELRTLPVHNYAGGGFFFETLAVIAPRDASAHRWHAFPDMQRDEVVVFRTFDSDRVARGETFWTPHSAFADPAVAPGRPSRRSIDLRATCLFA
jgi:hypothetical protein